MSSQLLNEQPVPGHTVGRSLSAGPNGAVLLARPDGADHDVVVKLFRPPVLVDAEAERAEHRSRVAAFLDTAKAQQALAATAQRWAPIHAFGPLAGGADDGAFYTTNHYPASAAWLVRGAVQLSAPALRQIVIDVLAGIAEVRGTLGRGHGNLSAGNVLLAGRDPRSPRAILTDLAPTPDPAAPPTDASDDRWALGALIHVLVTHRPVRRMMLLPIAADADWAALGRRGERWLSLCNQLLERDPAKRPDLAAVAAELGGSGPTRVAPWIRRTAAVAASLVVVGGAVLGGHAYLSRRSPPQVIVVPSTEPAPTSTSSVPVSPAIANLTLAAIDKRPVAVTTGPTVVPVPAEKITLAVAPPPPPPEPPVAGRLAPLAASASPGSGAVFVGVNQFTDDASLRPLAFAVDDAIAQAHLLVLGLKLVAPAHCCLVLGGEPSTDRTRAQLKELTDAGALVTPATRRDVLRALVKVATLADQPSDVLIVSLASHGFEEGSAAYVLPSDGTRGLLADTALRLDAVAQRLSVSKSAARLMLVDACREKATTDTRGGDTPMGDAFKQALSQAPGQAVLASCSPGQVSYEDPAQHHGVFTACLLQALSGEAPADSRGRVTLGGVTDRVAADVKQWVANNKPGVDASQGQSPWYAGPPAERDAPLALDPAVAQRLAAFDAERQTTLNLLKARIDVDGPFTPELFGKLAGVLKGLDATDGNDRDFLRSVSRFAAGGTSPAAFVPTLQNALNAAASHRKLTIGMMPKMMGNAYSIACRKGAIEAANELGDTLLWSGPTDWDAAKQIEVVDGWLMRRVDAIAVSADNADSVSPALQAAQAKGIKVVSWEDDTLPDARDLFVNQATPEAIGTTLMDAAAAALGGKGDFAIITASLTSADQNEWMKWVVKRRAANRACPKIT
jgi:hypothetical protein